METADDFLSAQEKCGTGHRWSEKSTFERWRWLQASPAARTLILYTIIIIAATVPTWDVYMWWGHALLFPAVIVQDVCKAWEAQGFGHVPWFAESAFGYGYPFLTFYAPLGFYIAAIFHFLLGFDYGPAAKLSFYLSLYVSGLLMYAFVYTLAPKEAWPRKAGWALAAASVYALTRYHLTDVFVRSVLAESWAWAALPGVFWGMEIARSRRLTGILLVSVMYGGLLLSHNITALWGTLFIALYALLTARDLKWPLVVMSGGLMGSALAAFFWYPALVLKGLTHSANSPVDMGATPQAVHMHAIFWRQHFVEALGYGASIPGPDDNLGINLGFAVVIGVLLALAGVFQKSLTPGQRCRIAVLLLLTLLILYIMSPQMPWKRVPAILLYIQFPWRLLIFTAFFGTTAMAAAAPVIDRWVHPLVMTAIAVVLAIPTLPFIFMPPLIKNMSPEQLIKWNRRYERKGLYANSANQEFLPKWVKGDYLDPRFLAEHPVPLNRLTVVSGDLVCNRFSQRGTSYDYSYTGSKDSETQVALFYWPGWELCIDGVSQPQRVRIGADGLISLALPGGSHHAHLYYGLSSQGKAARAFSIAAAAAWLAIAGFGLFKKQKNASSNSIR